MSDIGFTGPSQNYTPGPGQDSSNYAPPSAATLKPSTYADTTTLSNLVTQAQDLIGTIQTQLINAVLGLSVSVEDTTLKQAVAQTWPTAIGDPPPNYVSYSYYDYLGNFNSSASTYIRNAYESAMQDLGGNDAIDLLPLVSLIAQEVSLIDDFATQNLATLSDSAEQRVCENFQDFLQAAVAHLQNIQYVFVSQTTPLPDTETSLLSQGDAANTQALFKVNVNKLNVHINQDIQTLQANFSQHAAQFYNYFLGPALNFRQNVSSQILPVYPGTLGANIDAAVNATNQNLNQSLVDQTSRTYFFDSQIIEVLNAIRQRDSYRDYISQLAAISGVPVVSRVVSESDTPEALAFFQSYTPPALPATPSFTSGHGELDGTLDPNAHPQYLLSSGGGIITGDIGVAPGVAIGGVDLPAHTHTGQDGSQIISGASIAEFSLTPGKIDPTAVPDTPTGFEVENTTVLVLPGGSPIANVYLTWVGDQGMQFEVQVSPLPSS